MTLPRSDSRVKGTELSQVVAPPRSGMRPSSARPGRALAQPVPRAATVAAKIAGSAASPTITFLMALLARSSAVDLDNLATGGEGRRRACAAPPPPLSD